jgi:hypothetical protein
VSEQERVDPNRMTTRQAANYLAIAYDSLKTDRCRGQLGIPFHRVGRLVRYRRADLDKYLENNRHGLAA